jgi:hypothetical protein
MATHCYIPVLGKRLRITRLDVCGNPPAAASTNNAIVTDGFITVSMSAEVEDGAEIITKKADGSLCVNQKLASSFKRFTVQIDFCGVNPSLLEMVTNANIYNDFATDAAGFTVGEGQIIDRFALELWTGVTGACLPGAAFAGGYLLLPLVVGGVLGDVTVDGENAVTFSVTGAYTQGGNFWGIGPYNVVNNVAGSPSPLPTALDPFTHMLLIDTSLAPPASACSPVLMPPYISSVTPATGLAAGGTALTLIGSGFTLATSVTVGGVAGTAFVLVNDTKITVTTAAHATGVVPVVVVRSAGGNITLPNGFTYV